MMEYAYIERNHNWDRDKDELVTSYQWVGRSRLAEVSPIEVMRSDGLFKNEFLMGNLRLRVVDVSGHHLIVTRDRHLAFVYKIMHRLIKSLEITGWYFIYILSIWGLATFHPAEKPTWRNIKALKWLAEKWGL